MSGNEQRARDVVASGEAILADLEGLLTRLTALTDELDRARAARVNGDGTGGGAVT